MKNFKKTKKFIVWASVDNYLGNKDTNSFFKNLKNKIKYTLGINKVSIYQMKDIYHIAQSYYSILFLKKFNYKSHYTGDYLNESFFHNRKDNFKRINRVLYNPAKGIDFINRLKKKYPEINFTPLINLTQPEMVNLFRSSKVYVDFGLHPGRDRIPREALINGCCIITSKFGSAFNKFDIPIDEKFKIDLNNTINFESNVSNLIFNFFDNYDNEILKFSEYKKMITNDKITLKKSIPNLKKSLIK